VIRVQKQTLGDEQPGEFVHLTDNEIQTKLKIAENSRQKNAQTNQNANRVIPK